MSDGWSELEWLDDYVEWKYVLNIQTDGAWFELKPPPPRPDVAAAKYRRWLTSPKYRHRSTPHRHRSTPYQQRLTQYLIHIDSFKRLIRKPTLLPIFLFFFPVIFLFIHVIVIYCSLRENEIFSSMLPCKNLAIWSFMWWIGP